jgi:hypothetical protein
MKKTDLLKVKDTMKLIARAVNVTENEIAGGIFCVHPFINSVLWGEKWFEDNKNTKIGDGLQLNSSNPLIEKYLLTNEDVFEEWYVDFCNKLEKIDSLSRLYCLWGTPWKMTFIKYCGEHLSVQDFSEFLADAWTSEDNPNMDLNVSIKESIKYFRKASKKYLMDKEEYAYYESLPEEITVYRGVGRRRAKYGLSWTDDEKVANWFKNRWENITSDNEPMLLKAVINKKDVLAYLNSRGERELVVDVNAIKHLIEEVV